MILDIVQYGHPALRAKGTKIDKFDDKLLQLAEDMVETMYDADGVGLAAQQIGRPIQLCVVDVAGVKDRPSQLRVGGEIVDIDANMPLVLVNPEVEPFGKTRPMAEGCLSFPEIRGEVIRPFSVKVKAQTIDGDPLEFEADGLLARAIQHEHDHLQGILFIDRMSPAEKKKIDPEIEELRAQS